MCLFVIWIFDFDEKHYAILSDEDVRSVISEAMQIKNRASSVAELLDYLGLIGVNLFWSAHWLLQ